MAITSWKIHYSTECGEWRECRAATKETCPYSNEEHGDVALKEDEDVRYGVRVGFTVEDLQKRPSTVQKIPSFVDARGRRLAVRVELDGSYWINKRHYAADGTPIVAASSLRARKSRARKLAAGQNVSSATSASAPLAS